MSDTRPIGVFDSGVGGLTVVRALTRLLPHENIVYFGDTARVPYGSKSPQTVREYAAQDTDILLAHHVKLVVVACNTVSAVALDVVQKRANVPVVGVIVPGAQAAVRTTKRKRVGVIGTAATVESKAYTNAIRHIDEDVEVFSRACPLFVPLAEEGWVDNTVAALVAREYLLPLARERIDTLVLGCTHYPLLARIIASSFPYNVMLVDPGDAVAASVLTELEVRGLRNASTLRPKLEFYVSDLSARFAEVGERFLGARMGRVQRSPMH